MCTIMAACTMLPRTLFLGFNQSDELLYWIIFYIWSLGHFVLWTIESFCLGFSFQAHGRMACQICLPDANPATKCCSPWQKNALKCKLKPAHKTVQDNRLCWTLFDPQTFLLFHSLPQLYYIFNVIFDSVHAASLSFHWQLKKVKTVSAPCKTPCVGWNCKALLLI